MLRLRKVFEAFLFKKSTDQLSANSRKRGCIHAGASGRSLINFLRSCAGSVNFKRAKRRLVRWCCPTLRNACIRSPLSLPAADMLCGVVRRKSIVKLTAVVCDPTGHAPYSTDARLRLSLPSSSLSRRDHQSLRLAIFSLRVVTKNSIRAARL